MSRRQKLVDLLDNLILRLYTRKYVVAGKIPGYHPLPWIGMNAAYRSAGTRERMRAVDLYLEERADERGVVLDVGCNMGFFSLSLVQKGYFVYGVDNTVKNLRVASSIASKLKEPGPFVPILMYVDGDNVRNLPSSDVTICLSIWHHWVQELGAEAAGAILSHLFENTRDVLFFDSGEGDTPEEYGLPLDWSDPKRAIEEYLENTLHPARISWLGSYRAFASSTPGLVEGKGTEMRNLFAVSKRPLAKNTAGAK